MRILPLKTLLLILIVVSISFIYQNTVSFSVGDLKTALTKQIDNVKILVRSQAPQKTTVYSTRDETGIIEFSDSLPTDASKTRSITIDSNANLVPAVQLNKNKSVEKENSAKDSSAEFSPMTPYTDPGKIKQLINDAKNIENALNTRKTTIDRQLNDL